MVLSTHLYKRPNYELCIMNYALNKHFDKLSNRLAKSQEPTALAQRSKLRVQSSKLRVQSSKLRVQSSKLKVQGSKNLSKKHWFRKNKC